MIASPYPWFGGKSVIAEDVWSLFGRVDNYVEPFFGSGAVLLGRPDFDPAKRQKETINDADGFVANFWRALKEDPESVSWWADYPINEIDLEARHAWLINRRQRLTWSLEDPDFYDAKIAGWWVWGIAQWIGSGWCSGDGPWHSDGAHIRKLPHLGNAGQGIKRQLPHLGDAGRGINRKLPHLGDAGQGIHAYLEQLADRLRNVRVCCGDWTRVIGESVTIKHGRTAIFLDPPYSDEAGRAPDVYSVDCGKVANDVREWCIGNGGNEDLRIVLCGYEGEHDALPWVCKASRPYRGGYGQQGNGIGRLNAKRERIWYSPSCEIRQGDLLMPA